MKALLLLLAFTQVPTTTDYQVSGTVVDHLTGRPLNHVLVQLLRVGKGGGDTSVLTAADGGFVFLHVPLGKFQLTAQKRGQMPQGFHSDEDYATAIVVDGHQKTDSLVFALRTNAAIDGLVLGDDGEPLSHAQVMLFHQRVTDGESQTNQMNTIGTSSSGQFHFGHLDAGSYYLAVMASQWIGQPASIPYPVTFYGDTGDASAARVISLAEGGSANLQINLHTLPAIKVKVANPELGPELYVPGPGGTRIAVPIGLASLGNGVTELSGVFAGRYEARFQQPNGREQSTQMVDLVEGSTLAEAEATTGAIAGYVSFEGARPTQNIFVFLQRNQMNLSAQIAANGSFRFNKIPAGTYSLQLNSPGLIIASIAAKGARMEHGKLQIPAAGSVELTITTKPAANLMTLQGIATSSRAGVAEAGVAGAMVLLMPEDSSNLQLLRRDQSDADGSFNLPMVVPGRYVLLAIDDGHDLAYKDQAVIRPYLAAGLPLTVSGNLNQPIMVQIQKRLH